MWKLSSQTIVKQQQQRYFYRLQQQQQSPVSRSLSALLLSSPGYNNNSCTYNNNQHNKRWETIKLNDTYYNTRIRSFSTRVTSKFDSSNDDDNAIENQKKRELLRKQQKEQEIRDALDNKTGRGWSDPWDLEDMLSGKTKVSYDELPDWTPQYVSRTSSNRVQLYYNKIPSLDALVNEINNTIDRNSSTSSSKKNNNSMPPHPTDQSKLYALWRKREHYKYINKEVIQFITPKIAAIQKLKTWDEKQDAIDELYEITEQHIRLQEIILNKHPLLHKWINRSIEEYLKTIRQEQKKKMNMNIVAGVSSSEESSTASNNDQSIPVSSSSSTTTTTTEASKQDDNDDISASKSDSNKHDDDDDKVIVPVFMECYEQDDGSTTVVPKILYPLGPSKNPHNELSRGSMVEEWDLAAHKNTKRIMIRSCTQQIAKILLEDSSSGNDPKNNTHTRIMVTGRQGTGKTATLASIVASARTSGYIVMFLPDGDRMRKNGYYVEPNDKDNTIYDLPILAQEVCSDLITSHGTDFQSIKVPPDTITKYFTTEQWNKLKKEHPKSVSADNNTVTTLNELLTIGSEKSNFASMCYLVAMDVLMNEKHDKPFLLVIDEYNCYYDKGQYYHVQYDTTVKEPIPYEHITLFRPFLQAMSINTKLIENNGEPKVVNPPAVTIKNGAIIVATTESHAVPRNVTDILHNNARTVSKSDGGTSSLSSLHVIDVPRLTQIEVEHMIANYECIGYGKLRFDRGDTISNPQEVAYLKTVSGSIAQKLFDACII